MLHTDRSAQNGEPDVVQPDGPLAAKENKVQELVLTNRIDGRPVTNAKVEFVGVKDRFRVR